MFCFGVILFVPDHEEFENVTCFCGKPFAGKFVFPADVDFSC